MMPKENGGKDAEVSNKVTRRQFTLLKCFRALVGGSPHCSRYLLAAYSGEEL